MNGMEGNWPGKARGVRPRERPGPTTFPKDPQEGKRERRSVRERALVPAFRSRTLAWVV